MSSGPLSALHNPTLLSLFEKLVIRVTGRDWAPIFIEDFSELSRLKQLEESGLVNLDTSDLRIDTTGSVHGGPVICSLSELGLSAAAQLRG